MSEKKEIQTQEISALPVDIISSAVAKGADLEQVEKLLELKERWEANEAKKAYHLAMAEFKLNPPRITKDSTVDFTSSKGRTNYNYASLANVMDKVNTALSTHGLSASFTTKQNGSVSVTCKITHALGHSEETTLSAAADQSGNKNSIQAIGSTVSYLQRYTLLSLCGLATCEQDNDATTIGESLTQEQLSKILDILDNLPDPKVKREKFLTYMGVISVDGLKSTDFQKAMTALEASKKKG